MARAFQFDVDRVVEELNRILQMELAAVIYALLFYDGHALIPITSWLRENAAETLVHAQEAGEMIMRLHKKPALGISALPTTPHNTIDAILAESIALPARRRQISTYCCGMANGSSPCGILVDVSAAAER